MHFSVGRVNSVKVRCSRARDPIITCKTKQTGAPSKPLQANRLANREFSRQERWCWRHTVPAEQLFSKCKRRPACFLATRQFRSSKNVILCYRFDVPAEIWLHSQGADASHGCWTEKELKKKSVFLQAKSQSNWAVKASFVAEGSVLWQPWDGLNIWSSVA